MVNKLSKLHPNHKSLRVKLKSLVDKRELFVEDLAKNGLAPTRKLKLNYSNKLND